MSRMSILAHYGQYIIADTAPNPGEMNINSRYSASADQMERRGIAHNKNTTPGELTGASNPGRIKNIIEQVFRKVFESRQPGDAMPLLSKSSTFPASYRSGIEPQNSRAYASAKPTPPLTVHQDKTSASATTNVTGSTRAQVVALNQTYLRAGIAALASMNQPGQPPHNDTAAQHHPALQAMIAKYRVALNLPAQANSLQHIETWLDNPDKFADNRLANESDKLEALGLQKEIKAVLTEAFKQPGQGSGTAKAKARAQFEVAITTLLNSRPWDKIQTSFSFGDKIFSSNVTPAGRITEGDSIPLFKLGGSLQGICSKTNTSTENAVNLWTSSFSVQEAGQTTEIFAGIRHGVNSAYGLPKGAERDAAAVNRAKQIVTAALAMQPAKLAQAREGNLVTLQLTSTSLLTPIDLFSSTEKSQLQDQLKAWQTLSAAGGIELDIMDKQGKPISVTLEVAAFNFGVNGLSQGRLKLGNAYSDSVNLPAMKQLLGNELSLSAAPGGWVQRYLASNPNNHARVRSLSAEIKRIWAKRGHHSDGGDPYKMATRIAMLSYEIGIIPCWNCKSGKDRTGWMDTEIKYAAVSHSLNSRQLNTGNLNIGHMTGDLLAPQNQELLQAVALNSGNQKIQEYNTGAPGNKCFKKGNFFSRFFANLSLRHRIGNHHTVDVIKGLSDLV